MNKVVPRRAPPFFGKGVIIVLVSKWFEDGISIRPGSVRLPIRGLVEDYRRRYVELTKSSRFHVQLYNISGTTYLHVKVPSETVKNVHYDVVLELLRRGDDIQGSEVRVFSNSPAFIYYYAYALYHYGEDITQRRTIFNRRRPPVNSQLIPLLLEHLPDAALTDPPEVRNPAQIPLPDKSIYFAIFYLMSLNPALIAQGGQHITEAQLKSSVMFFDKLSDMRRREENKQRAEKARRRAEDEAKIEKPQVRRPRSAVHAVKPRSAIKAVKPTAAQKPTKPGK